MIKILRYIAAIAIISLVLFVGAYAASPYLTHTVYEGGVGSGEATTTEAVKVEEPKPVPKVASHIKTPEPLKALYMTSWVAGVPRLRDHVVSVIDKTEANALVIDIKDYTGRVAFPVNDPELAKIGSSDKRVTDIDAFIAELHSKNIYVIGRIAAFQDPYMVKIHPEFAVTTKAGAVWKDYKGISWIDAGAKGNWDYLISLAREAYSRGFDEVNFDYIRFPSDGNMKDIAFPFSGTTPKSTIMRQFYEYVHEKLSTEGKDRITTSADLFGMTTTATDDMNIGQVLTDALANFDYVAPMVYPSHFPATWNGFPKPATEPYKVIKISMGSAVKRAEAASTSPLKLRPWLQDFDLGAVYTADMVRAQMQAAYDVGLTSWMIWEPSNKYLVPAFLPAN